MSQIATKSYGSATEVSGDYRDMLVRLMTRQLWAETATAEVFGRSISSAPTWNEKFQAAEFAFEEAQHSQMLIDLLEDLGEDVPAILDARPNAANFWRLDLDDWVHIAVFNFTVDRGGSQQIMEYAKSSYRPWAEKMDVVLADEEEHYGNGVNNLREFAKDPAQLAHFQGVFNDLLPNAVKRCFGRPEGPDNDFCLARGLKRNSTEKVINRYLLEMREYMVENGLKFPPMAAFTAERAALLPSTEEIIVSLQ